jgi:hypothetical protein
MVSTIFIDTGFPSIRGVPIKNIKIYIIISINKTVTTEVESVKNSLA